MRQVFRRSAFEQLIDVVGAEGEDEDVGRTEHEQRTRRRTWRQERRHGVRSAQQPVDGPGLPSHLGGEPAGEGCDERQRKTQEYRPQQRTPLQQTLLERQQRATPGDQQHEEATPHHDPEGEERDGDRRTLAAREVSQSDLLRVEAHRCNHAAEHRHRDRIVVLFVCGIGPRKQDFGCGLFVMPARFDRCELDGLIAVHIIADQMSEQQLDRQQDRGEKEAHPHHHTTFRKTHSTQRVPRTCRRDTERPSDVSRQQHMRKPHPDHRTEDDLRPVVRHVDAALDRVPHRILHPAVVHHDPERRERRAERDHRRREEIESRLHLVPAEQQHAEERRLEHEGGEGLIGQQRSLDRPRKA